MESATSAPAKSRKAFGIVIDGVVQAVVHPGCLGNRLLWLQLLDHRRRVGNDLHVDAGSVHLTESKLAQVSKSGDEAAVKTQIGALVKACGGCHESFREKR